MKKLFQRVYQNDFFRGSFLLTAFGFLAGILNYINNILNARYLGPAGYGEIAALFSYAAVIAVPISIITTYILQRISSVKTEKKISYARSVEIFFWSKMHRWWFVVVLPFLLIPFVPRITNLSLFTSVILITYVLFSFFSSFYLTSVQGLRLFFLISIIGFVAGFIRLAGPVLVGFGVDGIATVLICILLSSVGSFVGYYFLFRKKVPLGSNDAHPITEKRIFHIVSNPYFLTLSLSTLATIFFTNVDIIFVKKFFPSVEAGIYSSWIICSRILYYVIGPLLSVGFIIFSDEKNKAQTRIAFITSFTLIILGGVVNYILYHWFGNWFILTVFGIRFMPAVAYLGQASIFAFLFSYLFFLNNYFLARRKKIVLAVPVAIPLYIIALFVFGNQLSAIMNVNIVFAGILSCIYTVGFIRSLGAIG